MGFRVRVLEFWCFPLTTYYWKYLVIINQLSINLRMSGLIFFTFLFYNGLGIPLANNYVLSDPSHSHWLFLCSCLFFLSINHYHWRTNMVQHLSWKAFSVPSYTSYLAIYLISSKVKIFPITHLNLKWNPTNFTEMSRQRSLTIFLLPNKLFPSPHLLGIISSDICHKQPQFLS